MWLLSRLIKCDVFVIVDRYFTHDFNQLMFVDSNAKAKPKEARLPASRIRSYYTSLQC